jgi:hypothetical protein
MSEALNVGLNLAQQEAVNYLHGRAWCWRGRVGQDAGDHPQDRAADQSGLKN